MSLKCVIIDDEPFARQLLAGYCSRVPKLDLAGSFSDGLEALPALQPGKVDLLFLDIQMPAISGLDLLASLTDIPLLIFTTAHAGYAVQGFEWDAVDYLLKPFHFPRFLKAVNKATGRIAPTSGAAEAASLVVKEGRDLIRLSLPGIIFIKGQKDYVQFHTQERRILSLMNLRDLERRLEPEGFLRVHQSYIVNMAHFSSYTADGLLAGRVTVPVSQSYRQRVKAYLQRLGAW